MSAGVSELKQLIDALKVKPSSKHELKEMLQKAFQTKSEEAIRKICERDLKKLQEWKLVEERAGNYCWYIYVNDFKDQADYSAKLLHSQKLVPALSRIAGIYTGHYSNEQSVEYESQEYASIQGACAERHLLAYPELATFYNDSKEERERAEEKKRQFNAKLLRKLDAIFGKEVVKSAKGVRPKSFVLDKIPSIAYLQILEKDQPLSFEIGNDGGIWLLGMLIAKGEKLSDEVRGFIERETRDGSNIATVLEISGIEEKASKALLDLQPKMRKLILRIEAGEPLLGRCDVCPAFQIREGTGQKERD